MTDYEICREEYKQARDACWQDKSQPWENTVANNWTFICWESKWPKDLRDRVKQSFSWY